LIPMASGSSTSRPTDVIYRAFAVAPREMSVYLDTVHNGTYTNEGVAAVLLQTGAGDVDEEADQFRLVRAANGSLSAIVRVGGTDYSSTVAAGTLATWLPFARVRLMARILPSGGQNVVQLSYRVGSGAWTDATA